MKIFELNDLTFLPHCACDVQFSFKPGETHVLVGENGIGKSTLLGRIAQNIPLEDRVIVEQKNYEFFFDRKVGLIKKFFLEAQFKNLNEVLFLKLWQNFNLNQKEDRLLSQLSGGEGQMLKLALTLCKNADFYLLDEPTQFLDEIKKQFLKNVLLEMSQQNKIIIMIEHNKSWSGLGWQIHELKVVDGILKQGEVWTIS